MKDAPLYKDYEAELDKAYGALGSYDYFQEIKIRALSGILPGVDRGDGRFRILDVGAGTGKMLSAIPVDAVKVGIEPDSELLRQVERPTLDQCCMVNASGMDLPFGDGTFDLIYMASVLHHVPPSQLEPLLTECRRILRPGGTLVVFEHNAYNLLVVMFLKLFVAIDKEARFLTPSAALKLIRSARMIADRPIYFCFFPKFLRRLLFLESWFWWLPLGGQFHVVARKV